MLSLTVLGGGFVKVQATEYAIAEVSDAYASSVFYDRLLEVELTGDHRYDALAVALSQLGYHEGDSEEEETGYNPNGGRNYQEYTHWWGKWDDGSGNGYSYAYAWCAGFVSWCLKQAQVPEEVAMSEISCPRMTNHYIKIKQFKEQGKGYKPIMGDIIMFADKTTPSHVGLVLGVKDGKVYTVEGNTGNNKVEIRKYNIDSTYIHGYCVPKYTTVKGTDYNALFESALNPVGAYIVTGKNLKVSENEDGTGEVLGFLDKGDEVAVTAFSGSRSKIEYQGKEGWISTSGTTNKKYMVYAVKFDPKGGKTTIGERYKIIGDTVKIDGREPTKAGYTFKGWSLDKSGNKVDYRHGDVYSADADATLYAVWEAYDCTVTFYDSDEKTVLYEYTYKYNDLLEPPEDPVKPDDGVNSYTFKGWNKELAQVVKMDLKYVAEFTATPLPPKEESNLWLIIGIGGGAVVLFTAIAVIIIRIKRKNIGGTKA